MRRMRGVVKSMIHNSGKIDTAEAEKFEKELEVKEAELLK